MQTLLECRPHCLFAAGRPHRFTHRRVAAVTLGKLQFSLGQADYHPARSRSISLSMYVLLTSDKPPTLPPVTPLVHLSAGLIDSGPARGPSILVLAVRRGAGLAAAYSMAGSTGLSRLVKGDVNGVSAKAIWSRFAPWAVPWMVRATVYVCLSKAHRSVGNSRSRSGLSNSLNTASAVGACRFGHTLRDFRLVPL